MRSVVVVSFLLVFGDLFPQSSVNGGKLNINTSRLTAIESIPLKDESGSSGEVYLTENIHTGLMDLGKLKIDDHRFRYDVRNDMFEIETHLGTKYLNGYEVRAFEIRMPNSVTRKFVRTGKIPGTTREVRGFIEILVKGDVSLIGYHYHVLLPANYIHGLDVGERSETSVLKVRYFFADGKSEPVEIKKRKELIKAFGNRGKTIDSFIKKNKIVLKRREDLIKLAEFVNS